MEDVCVHCFMDGRDTPPNSGVWTICRNYSRRCGRSAWAASLPFPAATTRWIATSAGSASRQAFGAMVQGTGHKATDPVEAMRRSYEAGVTDEFIEPVTIVDQRNEPVGLIRDEDAVIFYNYRADRAREMTMALTDATLERPARSLAPRNLHYTTMTQYDKTFPLPFVLPREHPNNILADVFARLNWKNLRVAETEKYAHVTYFFNGGNEKPYPGEEREMVPSPKVATYDLKPEMSAPGITDVVVKAINTGDFDVIVMNFANADMVGHSGKMEPDGQRGRSGGRLSGADLSGAAAEGRRLDHQRRPRQRRDDDRSGHQASAHLPHHQSGAVHSGERPRLEAAAGRRIAGHRADAAGRSRRAAARRNEGAGSAAVGSIVTPELRERWSAECSVATVWLSFLKRRLTAAWEADSLLWAHHPDHKSPACPSLGQGFHAEEDIAPP